MFDEPLSADLKQVELDFGSFMQFDPQAEFSHRIGCIIRDELRRERKAAYWKFILALGASALIWMNLSLYAASITDFHFHARGQVMPIEQLAQELQTAIPKLTYEAALRQARFFQSNEDLISLIQL